MRNTQCKRILNICTFFVCLMVLPLINVKALECVTYTNGSGTEEDPYVITTSMELYSIRCNMSSHFVLGNNIDLTYDTTNENGLFYNEGTGWESIGDATSDFFTGSLDGKNYTIKGFNQNISITPSFWNNGGLFAGLSGVVKNINFTEVNITAKNHVYGVSFNPGIGTVAGRAKNAKINNITASGNMEISTNKSISSIVGGIVGETSSSTLQDLKSDIDIIVTNTDQSFSNSEVGGIIGLGNDVYLKNIENRGNIENDTISRVYDTAGGIANYLIDSTLINCRNYGNIKAQLDAGGIAWKITGTKSIISYSANYGTITAPEAGGLFSDAKSDTEGQFVRIEKSYNAGEVNTSSKVGGGLVAIIENVIINDSFNIGNINFYEVELEYNEERGIGGLVGMNYGTNYVSNSYNAGMIYCVGENTHEYVIHETLDEKNLTNSSDLYYMIPTFPIMSFTVESYGNFYSNRTVIGEEVTKFNWSKEMTYGGFDFTNTWYIDPTSEYQYPQLVNNPVEGNYATNIHLSDNITQITLGQYIQLSTIVSPSSIANKDVEYLLYSEMHIDKIEDGKFIPKRKGTYRIIVFSKSLGGIHDELELTVNPIKLNSINITGEQNVKTTKTYYYTAEVLPTNAENKNVTWSVENVTGTATISSTGTLKPKTEGTVIVRATAKDGGGAAAEMEVTIYEPKVLKINVEKEEYELPIKTKSFTILPEVIMEEDGKYTLSWTSTDENVVKVEDGAITIVGIGSATITIKATSGEHYLEKNISFRIINPITSIRISYSQILYPNTSGKFYTEIYPTNTTDDKTISWSSSDTSVATIDQDGVITGVKRGETTITATTINGITATYKIKIKDPKILDVIFDQEEYVVEPHLNTNYQEIKMKIIAQDFEEETCDIISYGPFTEENYSQFSDCQRLGIAYYGNYSWETSDKFVAGITNWYDREQDKFYTNAIWTADAGTATFTLTITTISGNVFKKDVTVKVRYVLPDYSQVDGKIDSKNNVLKLYNTKISVENLYDKIINSRFVEIRHDPPDFYYYNSLDTQYKNRTIITGDYVQYNNEMGERKNLYLSVNGDVNGDGDITPLDYVKIKNHIMGSSIIEGNAYLSAADYNEDNDITPLDYVKVKNYIMNGGQ